MNNRIRTLFIEFVTAMFVLLFVYAALSKILDFDKFRIELGKSPILNPFAHIIAFVIPTIEIVISGLLIAKRTQLYALYASFCLMLVFSFYIIAILKFSSYVPCTCGGILQNMSWKQHLFFNLAFIAIAVIAILLYPKENSRTYVHDKEGKPEPYQDKAVI